MVTISKGLRPVGNSAAGQACRSSMKRKSTHGHERGTPSAPRCQFAGRWAVPPRHGSEIKRQFMKKSEITLCRCGPSAMGGGAANGECEADKMRLVAGRP